MWSWTRNVNCHAAHLSKLAANERKKKEWRRYDRLTSERMRQRFGFRHPSGTGLTAWWLSAGVNVLKGRWFNRDLIKLSVGWSRFTDKTNSSWNRCWQDWGFCLRLLVAFIRGRKCSFSSQHLNIQLWSACTFLSITLSHMSVNHINHKKPTHVVTAAPGSVNDDDWTQKGP